MAKIILKTEDQIALIRKASQITSSILDKVADIIKPGITTEQINTFVHNMTLDAGATPACLGYSGFPKSVCTSINDVICHGIPSKYEQLNKGDIVNVDVTSIWKGYHGDSSRMYFVGGAEACSDEAVKLVEITKEALHVGIEVVKPGARVGDIGAAIQEFITKQEHDYGIVREYTGHGIGASFHESPQIVHFGKSGTGPVLKKGMVFTIEPMINLGTYKTVLSKLDGWTVRTADGELSAQWEHTIAVTDDGYEILT